MLKENLNNTVNNNSENNYLPDWFNKNWMDKWVIASIHTSRYYKDNATEKMWWWNIPFAFKWWEQWYIEDYWINPMSLATRCRVFDELPREYNHMYELMWD